MGIVKLQPDAQPSIQVTTPSTIEAPSKSTFTALVPESKITSLLKYVEGYPWTVDYYGQILNTNNTINHFDPSIPNLTQSYYKVNKLILQVSSPLSSSYDQSTGITSITGSAIAPYGITPNVGDVFIAQVDSGEDAIFLITNVARKTHRKDTLYDISYTLYSYTSAQPSFLTTLNERVNEVYYFNDDTNFSNRDILIKPSVQEAIDRLKLFLHESQEYYFYTFGQKQTGSILIPGIMYSIYDPLLLNFISKVVDYNKLVDTPFYRYTYFSKQLDQPSIFDALINCSASYLTTINRTYNFVSSASLSNKARFGTVFFAGIDYILYPTNPDYRTDIGQTKTINDNEFINTIKNSKNYTGLTPLTVKTSNNNRVFVLNVLPELFKDNYYVVTKTFYDYQTDKTLYSNMSFIELLIHKFINKEAISKEDLVIAVEKYKQWSLLHQLYILPVMWLLAKASI